MSRMPTFDSQATLTVSEGYDFANQRHYTKTRCGCDYFHARWSFRVWQVLLFLLVLAVVITIMGLLIAMYGPGNAKLSYSKEEAVVGPTVMTTGGEHSTTGVSPTTKEPSTTKGSNETTVSPTNQQSTSTLKPSKAQQTTAKPTTMRPTTSAPTDKESIQCGVAIVGGGTGGLLMAYFLLKEKKETNVCIFERENHLGGKIFDHHFTEAPNVAVGLGVWNAIIRNYNFDQSEMVNALSDDAHGSSWIRKLSRVEARGVYADTFDSLKKKAFQTLLNHTLMNNKTLGDIVALVRSKNADDFSTAGTFLSSYLSPEGAKLMEDAYGFKGVYMEQINTESYKKYLTETKSIQELNSENDDDDLRPDKGMSEIINKLELDVKRRKGKIHRQETVTSVNKEGDKFVLLTSNLTVQANKTVLAVAPAALKKISGDIVENITNHEIFKSIVSVPAFFGAAVYPTAWWNDSVAAQKNNALEDLHMFISSSDCLGITMPYKGTGPNGTAVLHTVANNGGCSDKWWNILKISKDNDAIDKEIKRALEYKFQRNIPVEPLKTVYKYWEEGFWHLQKPGTNFSLAQMQLWATRPLAGSDVFLVGKAFYNFGGWLKDTISSTDQALKRGWNVNIRWPPS